MIIFGMLLNALFFASGTPIFAALAIGSALIMIFHYHLSLANISMVAYASINSWILVAMPLFVLAGYLMVASGTVKALMDFFDSLFRHFRGGLIVASVAFSTVFAALCGSESAAVAAVGIVMVPEMLKRGYSRELTSGIVCAGGALGPLIPPSIVAIIMATLVGVSVGKLFAAQMMPGLLIAIGICIVGVIICLRGHASASAPASWRVRRVSFVKAIPGLVTPVIILGGIYSGFFTPTEAAAVACIYTLFVGTLVYRKLTWKETKESILKSAKLTAIILILLAGLSLFSYTISRSGIPVQITQSILSAGLSPLAFMLIVSLVYLGLGFFIPAYSMAFIMIPILMPTVIALDINPIWFGVIFCINIIAAELTPPMAFLIYVTAQVTNIPFEIIAKGILPFAVLIYAVMFLVTFFPELALWLPRMMGMP